MYTRSVTYKRTVESQRPAAPAPLILNVDDTEFTRRAVTRVLEQAGFRVLEGGSGEEALRLAEYQPDLILLDVELPDIRGLEVVRRLKARETTAQIPIAHLSATRITMEDWARGLNVGADAYLVHPVDPAVLIATIHALLRMRRALDRMMLLQRFTSALAGAATPLAVAHAVLDSGLLAADASNAAVALIDGPDALEVLAMTEGWPAAMRGDGKRIALHAPTPLTVCAWTGEPLWIGSPDELRATHPNLISAIDAPAALACVPLTRGGKSIGALGFAFAEPTTFNEVARALLCTIVDQSSQALERAQLDAQRTQLEEALRRSVKARDDMLAIVSHDLRNPLGVITIAAAMLARSAGETIETDKVVRYADRILTSARRMDALMGDLLDAASLDSGRFRIELAKHAAHQIVADAIEQFAPLANEKSVRIEHRVDGAIVLECDKKRVLQALSNLLSNAVKFTAPGGKVVVSAEEGSDAVEFAVSDTGPGIADDQLPHLFDRYWKGSAQAGAGVGLGLYIVKGIVNAHEGNIEVRSRVGAGTTFVIRLPKTAPATDGGAN